MALILSLDYVKKNNQQIIHMLSTGLSTGVDNLY